MEKLMESFLAVDSENLYKFGMDSPFAVAFLIHGEKQTIYPMDLNNKDVVMRVLRKLCKEYNTEELIIMSEGYISNDLSDISPSKARDRQEAIVVQVEDIYGNNSITLQPFHRKKEGNIIFEDKIKHLNVSPFGLMPGILGRALH